MKYHEIFIADRNKPKYLQTQKILWKCFNFLKLNIMQTFQDFVFCGIITLFPIEKKNLF